jgi:hypothetical protein
MQARAALRTPSGVATARPAAPRRAARSVLALDLGDEAVAPVDAP